MNKLKQELRDKLLSHLSDHNTEANVNIAFDVCKDFSISFISFCARNFEPLGVEGEHFKDNLFGNVFSKEELFNKFLEEYEGHSS